MWSLLICSLVLLLGTLLVLCFLVNCTLFGGGFGFFLGILKWNKIKVQNHKANFEKFLQWTPVKYYFFASHTLKLSFSIKFHLVLFNFLTFLANFATISNFCFSFQSEDLSTAPREMVQSLILRQQ